MKVYLIEDTRSDSTTPSAVFYVKDYQKALTIYKQEKEFLERETRGTAYLKSGLRWTVKLYACDGSVIYSKTFGYHTEKGN